MIAALAIFATLFAQEELDRHIELMTGSAPEPGAFVVTAGDGEGDGFRICASNGIVTIAGESPRGALYGVYELLERYGDCGWYAPWRTVVPKCNRFEVPDGTLIEDRPAFAMRQPSWYGVRTNQLFAARCRLNGESPDGAVPHPDPKYGGFPLRFAHRLFASHTILTLVPPERYFAAHPEYFSEIGGRRIAESTQLCFSNPEVAEVAASNALALAAADPGCRVVGVSQMDWGNFCECACCRAIVEEEGSLSGLTLRFVNAVAARIERVRPDLMVETIAYGDTFKPPRKVRPRANVILCCCTAADYAEPLATARRTKNLEWKRDYEAWASRTDNIYQWDYTPNFRWFFLPHPNIGVYGPNMRYYRDHGAKWVYMDGQPLPGGDFGDLRCWVLAKLMWNPDQSTDELVVRFCRGAYGAGAPYVRAAFNLCEARLKACPETVLTYGCEDNRTLFPDDCLRTLHSLWTCAETAAQGEADAAFCCRIGKYPSVVALLNRLAARAPSHSVTAHPERFVRTAELDALLSEEAAIRAEAAARGVPLHFSLQRGQDDWMRRRLARLRSAPPVAASTVARLTAADFCVRDGDFTGGEWNERHGYHARRVVDPSAVGGEAVEVFARDGLDAIRYFLDDLAFDPGVPLALRIHAKGDHLSDGGPDAFTVLVKDADVRFRRDVAADEIAGDWRWIDLGSFLPKDGLKLDVRGALSGRCGLKSAMVDAIEILRTTDTTEERIQP